MRYHGVHRAWLRTPPAAGAADAVIGAWVRLTAFAAEAELGEPSTRVTRHRPLSVARLTRARIWSRRAWAAACDTTRPAVDAVVRAGLARWDGDDLLVDGYDGWGQQRTRLIRHDGEDVGGKSGGGAGQESGEDAGERSGQPRVDVAGGDVPEGTDAESGALPSVDPPPGSPTPDDPTPPEAGEAQRPELAREPDEPDPAAQLAHCLRARSGTFATAAERRALVDYCASLPRETRQPALDRLWTYWHKGQPPTVTAWLETQHGRRR
jgi:hypothetical protein